MLWEFSLSLRGPTIAKTMNFGGAIESWAAKQNYPYRDLALVWTIICNPDCWVASGIRILVVKQGLFVFFWTVADEALWTE